MRHPQLANDIRKSETKTCITLRCLNFLLVVNLTMSMSLQLLIEEIIKKTEIRASESYNVQPATISSKNACMLKYWDFMHERICIEGAIFRVFISQIDIQIELKI
jgi:hypothetical protein